jgi:hypothetical protein
MSAGRGTPPAAARPGLSFGAAEVYSGVNALFESKEGWIGADGAYSVEMSPQRRLWLFSDTWVGLVREGKRTGATMVNNSVGLQEGPGPTSTLRFTVLKDAKGKPAAVFAPAEKRGWFWLQAGAYVDKHLFVFLSHVEKTDSTNVFGFRQIGQSLGVVSNPEEDPRSWRYQQNKIPCSVFGLERQLTFGAAVIQDREYLYVYGTDEDIKRKTRDRFLVLARVPLDKVQDFAAWRFYDGHGWNSDFRTSSRLVDGMASECSVSYLPEPKQYVLVYTEAGLSDRILARTAPAPMGPWSVPVAIYRCPEVRRDKRIFCYAAKAHPTLSSGQELVISYVANSFDFWQVASDASIYLPRFIRVPYRVGN